MKKNTSLLLHLLFVVIVIIELAGRLLDNVQLEYFVKPLIMIWIGAYFLISRKKKDFTLPVLVAFFFSWMGDLFLMFSGGYSSETFFFLGVGGFFCAQLSYIYVFSRYSEQTGKGLVQKKPYFALLFLAYLAIMLIILFPNMEGLMKAIIALYGLTLLGMSMMALNRKGRVNHQSYLFVFLGSILFVVSDSMIAFNKFAFDIPLAGFWIMLTYMSAQYLIMRGLILEK